MIKKTIRWTAINGGEAGVIIRAASDKYNFVRDDAHPDVVFCGAVFNGLDARNPFDFGGAIRIFCTGEFRSADFNLYDYSVGYDDVEIHGRNFYYPFYFWTVGNGFDEIIARKKLTAGEIGARKFCNFIYSNANAPAARTEIFNALQRVGAVDSCGMYMNNQGGKRPATPADKIALQAGYYFSIAAENAVARGYTTEKILDALRARSIPIYFGDPDVARHFNPKCFINAADFGDFDELAAFCAELGASPARMLKYLNAPVFVDDPRARFGQFQKFLRGIFDDLPNARRAPYGMFPTKFRNLTDMQFSAVFPARNFWQFLFSARLRKPYIFIRVFGVRIVLTDLWFWSQKIIKSMFVIRVKRGRSVVKLFGITVYDQSDYTSKK